MGTGCLPLRGRRLLSFYPLLRVNPGKRGVPFVTKVLTFPNRQRAGMPSARSMAAPRQGFKRSFTGPCDWCCHRAGLTSPPPSRPGGQTWPPLLVTAPIEALSPKKPRGVGRKLRRHQNCLSAAFEFNSTEGELVLQVPSSRPTRQPVQEVPPSLNRSTCRR